MRNGWQTRPLADVCEIKPPKAEARGRVTADALVSFAPMEDLGIDRKFLNASQTKPLASVVGSYTYFADGDVLLAKITPCFENGKLGIAADLNNGIGFGSSEFIVFRPSTSLDKEFLYYFLARPEFRIEGAARMGGAVGQQRVPKEFIESYPIPVPPIIDQKRIVGILDEAFEGIATAKANAEKNLENARALFESYLDSVFTRRNNGWPEKRLEEVVDDTCTLSYGIVQPGHEIPNGLPVVRPTDLTAKVIRLEGLKRIDPRLAASYRRTEMHGGEILLCVRGSTGTVSVASTELSGANVTRGIVPIRFERSLLTQDFGYYLMTSGEIQKQIREKTYGAALMQINICDLRQVTLFVPPLKEQKAIVGNLDNLSSGTQRLANLYQRKLAVLEALKKSLLHQAFTGNL
jgi:type I restriction enzyme, S subunit